MMLPEGIRSLDELLTLLAKHNVCSFTWSTHQSVVVFDRPRGDDGADINTRPLELSVGPKRCDCGHDETQHAADGLCLEGCPADTCYKPKADDSGKLADDR